MSEERVPFYNGMQRGYGFNSFLQEIRNHGAVSVSDPGSPPKDFQLIYDSKQMDTYEKLVQSLNVSTSASISGYGASGTVAFEFADRSEYETSTVTYVVRVDSEKRMSTSAEYSFSQIPGANPHEIYGDRYIAGFINGGHYYARVSISSVNKSNSQEVSQSASVAFSMFKVGTEVSEAVKTALESLSRTATVTIYSVESSSTPARGPARHIIHAADPQELLNIKQKADNFYEEARQGRHDFHRFAILQKYTNLKNFNNFFTPLDYSDATNRTWELFDHFSKYVTYEKVFKALAADKFEGDATKKSALERERADEMEVIGRKILTIANDPSDAKIPGTYTPPDEYFKAVVLALKKTTYIAQSRPTRTEPNQESDVVLPTLLSNGKKRFDFNAFAFEGVLGTTLVSFGVSTDGKIYTAQLGQSIRETPGFQEESKFWIFEDRLKDVAEKSFWVSRMASKNYLMLDLQESAVGIKLWNAFAL